MSVTNREQTQEERILEAAETASLDFREINRISVERIREQNAKTEDEEW